MKKIIAFLASRGFTPWLLLILTILSFGLLVPFMGFFMDDWYLVWFKHTFGALQYPAYFSLDRPLMGYFYVAANTLLFNSESPFVWHVFGLITRWVCTLALWQFLNNLWPKNTKQNTWVALLAAVFPGFIQHWIIVVYSFFYICLAGLFFSFTLMIRAIKTKKRFWLYYVLSILIGFYSYAAAEFYFGLELIRPLIIWFVLAEVVPLRKQRFWSTLKYWSPYLAVFIAFSVWRAFFFVSMNHEVAITTQLTSSLKDVLLGSVSKVIQAIVDAVVGVWSQPLYLANYPSMGKTALMIIVLTVIVFLSLAWWLHARNKSESKDETLESDIWSRQSFWLAAVSLVVAVMPFWAANLEVSTRYPYDRFLLAYLLGSCLLLAGMVNQFARSRTLQIVFLSLLVAAGTAYQFNQMVRYKNLGAYQNELMWHLVWRAPDLHPGTTVFAYGLPYQDYLSGNALTTEINWIYSADQVNADRKLNYFFIFLNSPQIQSIEELSPNHTISYDFRTYKFTGSTNQTLMISDNSLGCLRVLDSNFTPAQSVVDLYPKPMLDAAGISNLDTIMVNAIQKTPPSHLFGEEPGHTWCYYFEKAELARQQQDYAQALSLVQEANQQGFYPNDMTEWYPFIDSALRLGHFDEAAELSARIILNDSVVHYGVCHTWENYIASLQEDATYLDKARAQFIKMECE